MKIFFIYTDGGAIGNPGPAGIGVVIKSKSQISQPKAGPPLAENLKTVRRISKYIGRATNNQAEYQALLRGLTEVTKLTKSTEVTEVKIFLDSELIVNQLNHKYKIKNSALQPLFLKVHNLAVALGDVKFEYIPREQNKEADRLVRQAIKTRQ